MHIFKQNVKKAVSLNLEYKTTHQHLSCNMLFVSLMCAPSSYNGSILVMHEWSCMHAWSCMHLVMQIVIFQSHIQEMTNCRPMLDLNGL